MQGGNYILKIKMVGHTSELEENHQIGRGKQVTSTEYVAGLFDLTGHVGIITGGSRGLGFGQVKVLTDAGATGPCVAL